MTRRSYSPKRDFHRVGEFLDTHYLAWNADGNWPQPAWEYMHFHPAIDEAHLDRCAVWEEEGEIVAVAHYEWILGEAFFQVARGREDLKPHMLDYVESAMRGTDADGTFVMAYCIDSDTAFAGELERRGYVRNPAEDRPMTGIDLSQELAYSVPPGFRVQSLADENDLQKIDRCLWRGFNHPGEPEGDLDGRRKMQAGPGFRHDLSIVVVAPGGEYVSLSGAWHDKRCGFAYIEPVATDPDYRRMGLGRAAVYEGLRRCAAEGATVGYVGSNQQFYLALGFRPVNGELCWLRRW